MKFILFVRSNCSMIQVFWSTLKGTDLGMHSTILSPLWLSCFGLQLIFVLITFRPLGLNEIPSMPAFLLFWKEMLWKEPGMKFVLFVRSNCNMIQEFWSTLNCTDLGMYCTVLLFGGLFVVWVSSMVFDPCYSDSFNCLFWFWFINFGTLVSLVCKFILWWSNITIITIASASL